MLKHLAVALSTLLVATSAQSQAIRPNGDITIGRIDSVWSPMLKEQRPIWIYTPPSYGDTAAPQRYPVLYLLDGDAHFHSVTGLLQTLGTGVNGTLVVPEMIVVAIPNTDRSRDLTPTHTDLGVDGKPNPAFRTTGGGPNFLRFIKSELIPHIDATYRTAPYRMLVGHSFGGISVIEALYTMPETFNSYVAIDPSLWWDNRVLLRQAKDYFTKANLSGRTLFVGQANTLVADDTTDNAHYISIQRFNRLLERYRPAGFRYGYKYYPDDSHGSVPLIAEYDALRFIFADYNLDRLRAIGDPRYVADHYRQVSSSLGYTVEPSDRMLVGIASIALQRDTTNAIALFDMNARMHPKSAATFDALGDIWLAKGDKARAAQNYQTALSLRPSDKHAAAMLQRARGQAP